jgi:IucA / IucC family/Ferric iron reductase FhuF-like transporter
MWTKPNPHPQHYLRPRAAGRAALRKLSLTYPDPVRWVHQEQTLNDRTTAAGDYSIKPTYVPPEFWPEHEPVFWLPEFEAPRDQFRLFQNQPQPLPWYLSGSSSEVYSHLIHPLSVPYFLNRDLKGARWKNPRFLATPMASHRTLLVWSPRSSQTRPFAVKSSLNIWVGGGNRNVRLYEIKRSVGISSLFVATPRADLEQQGILLLDDPIGLLHKQTNAGLLARDTPWKLGPGEEIVPVFSLCASRQDRRPRIVELVEASGLEPSAWVDTFVLQPLIYQAYFLGMTEGVVGEMHEQNILMELRDGIPTKRFWHRDLGGFRVDNALRRLANKGLEALPANIHLGDLGEQCNIFHRWLHMYLQGSLVYAVAHALRNHFEIPTDDFLGLYNARASKLQDMIFSLNGLRTSRNFEKDFERYRKRMMPGVTWPWKNLEAALRDW